MYNRKKPQDHIDLYLSFFTQLKVELRSLSREFQLDDSQWINPSCREHLV